jgi:hypothetical protein
LPEEKLTNTFKNFIISYSPEIELVIQEMCSAIIYKFYSFYEDTLTEIREGFIKYLNIFTTMVNPVKLSILMYWIREKNKNNDGLWEVMHIIYFEKETIELKKL